MIHRTHTAVRALALALALFFSLNIIPVQASADGGSAELIVSDSEMEMSAKLFADPENLMFALLAGLCTGSDQVAEGGIYLTQQGLSVAVSPYLAEAYGINFASVEENLPNSIFAPDSGSHFALDEETYLSLVGGLAGFKAGFNAGSAAASGDSLPVPSVDSAVAEQIQAVAERYTALISDAVSNNLEVSVGPETITVDDREIKTSCMTMTLSGEALATATEELLTAAAEDAELKEVVKTLYQLAAERGAAMGQNADLPDAEILDSLWEQLPALRDEAAQAFRDSEAKLVIAVNTSRETGSPIRMQAVLTIDGSSLGLRGTLTQDDYPGIILELVEDDDIAAVLVLQLLEDGVSAGIVFDDGSGYSVAARIVEDSEELFTATLSIEELGVAQSSLIYACVVDKVNSRITLCAIEGEDTNEITFSYAENGGDLVITLETVDGEAPEQDIRLVLHGSDSVTFPDFTEILTMTETEFAGVMSNVLRAADTLFG